MKYNLTKLKNNLEVLSVPVSGMESVTLTVSVKTGSRNEDSKISGISHFLEHMAFKGGAKYNGTMEVSEAIDAIGGNFNAYTSKEWTQYFIKCRSGVVDTAFDVLSDMLIKPTLKAKDIESEKGIIQEELKMREDVPMIKIYYLFDNLIFSGNDMERDIIGTKESINYLKQSHFKDYIGRRYFTENMLIAVSGGITSKKVDSLSRKYFSKLKKGKDTKLNPTVITQKKAKTMLLQKDNEQTHMIVGFVGYPRGHKNRYKETVLSSILGGGMSSRLFQEVREKRGLAYAVKNDVDHNIDSGSFYAYAGVDPKRADLALKTILDQYYGLASKKYKISAKELKKAKEYIKGNIALSLEDTRNINEFFGLRHLFLGSMKTPDKVYKEIDKVTTNDVVKLAKELFNPAKLNLAMIGPNKNKKTFEKIVS